MEEQIIDIILYTVPSVVTGFVAYYFFHGFIKSENRRKNIELLRDAKKEALPIRLQAYERMTLFLERINPSKLLIRVTPTSEDKDLYIQKLALSIEQEFEHNLSQQVYISDDCWNAVIAAKNATSRMIIKTGEQSEVTTAQDLREIVLKQLITNAAPSLSGISFIKEEIKELF